MKRAVALTVVAMVVGASPPFAGGILAQEKPADCVPRFNDGVKRVEAKDWAGAVAIWTPLRDCLPEQHRPVWHLYIGLANKELKRLPEAWHHLAEYLRTSGKEDPETGKDLEEVEKALLKQGYQKVSITCHPDGTVLTFDDLGAPSSKAGVTFACPLTWWLKPGRHGIWALRDSCDSKEVPLDIQERGGKAGFEAKLDSCYGKLVIKGDREATQVFLDGLGKGLVPFEQNLKIGTYELAVGPAGQTQWKKKVRIRMGETTVEEPEIAQTAARPGPADPGKGATASINGVPDAIKTTKAATARKRPLRAAGAALLAGGTALGVVGVALHVKAYYREVDLYDYWQEKAYKDGADYGPQYDADYEDEVRPRMTAAAVMYAVGGTAAAAGIVALVVDAVKARRRGSAVALSPRFGPGSLGASMEWSF